MSITTKLIHKICAGWNWSVKKKRHLNKLLSCDLLSREQSSNDSSDSYGIDLEEIQKGGQLLRWWDRPNSMIGEDMDNTYIQLLLFTSLNCSRMENKHKFLWILLLERENKAVLPSFVANLSVSISITLSRHICGNPLSNLARLPFLNLCNEHRLFSGLQVWHWKWHSRLYGWCVCFFH